MSVPHKIASPAVATVTDIVGSPAVSAYRPQTLSPGHHKISPEFTRFILPRRLGPLLFLVMACVLCIAAMFIIGPVSSAPVPPAQPYVAPVVASEPVAVPAEIAEIASLIPPAAAAELPITQSKNHTAASKAKITIIDPETTPADKVTNLLQAGIAAARAGQRDKALSLFSQAHRLAPDNNAALFNLAVLHDRMGDTAQAADLYRQVMANPQPGNAIDYRRVAARITVLQAALDKAKDDIMEADNQ